MKRFHSFKILTVTLALSFSSLAFSAPATDANIDKLIKLSQLDIIFNESLKELQPLFEKESEDIVLNLSNSTTLSPKHLAIAQQLSQAMSNITQTALKDPKVTQKLKDTLKSTYTDKEVNAYNQFLSTPEGQSINRKSPSVTIEIQRFMEEIIGHATQTHDFDRQVEEIIAPLLEQ